MKQFVINPTNSIVTITGEDEEHYYVEFDGSNIPNIDHYWASTTPDNDPLLFIPANSIHAFNLKENCEATPDETAHVAVWARSNADKKANDYGTTVVCGLKDKSLPKTSINSKYANVKCTLSKYRY